MTKPDTDIDAMMADLLSPTPAPKGDTMAKATKKTKAKVAKEPKTPKPAKADKIMAKLLKPGKPVKSKAAPKAPKEGARTRTVLLDKKIVTAPRAELDAFKLREGGVTHTVAVAFSRPVMYETGIGHAKSALKIKDSDLVGHKAVIMALAALVRKGIAKIVA